MDYTQTIDTENDVLSVRPRQEAHFEEEQQRKRTKFSVSGLESESGEEDESLTAEVLKWFLSQLKSKKGRKKHVT